MQVFENDHQRLARGEVSEELDDRLAETTLLLLWFQRHPWREVRDYGGKLREQLYQLGGGCLYEFRHSVWRLGSDIGPQQIKQWGVGQHPIRLEAVPLEDSEALVRRMSLYLGDKARLTDPCLTSDQRRLPAPTVCLSDQVIKGSELYLAPNKYWAHDRCLDRRNHTACLVPEDPVRV
jgi:hypothetical protein